MAAGRRLLGAALLAGLVSMSARAGAEDFSGRAIVSEQDFSSGDISTRAFDQLYELRFERRVIDPFSYLLFFRGEQADGHSTIGSDTSSLRFRQLEPHAEATYTLPTIQLLGRYDLVDSNSRIGGQPDDRRRLESLFGMFSFLPDALPGVRLLAERTHAYADRSSLDQTQTYLQGDLDFRWGKFGAAATARRSEFDDSGNGLNRKTNGVQGNLFYQDSLLRGRVTVLASVLASRDRETDTTRSAAAAGETPVTIGGVFSSIDDTPDDSRDNSGIPTPALIDGNLRVPTVIDIGPGGASFENISVDLRRFTELDTFRIDVRDSGGNFVPRGEPVDFTVWTSPDAIRWTPVFGAKTTFLSPLSLYEVTFPRTIARFFKVVSFDLAPTDARVTEIRAYVHKSFGPDVTQTTDITLATENATVTFHPLSGVALFYYGLFNQSREQSEGRPENSTTDADQVVSASWDVSSRINLLGQYQWRNVTATAGGAQRYRALTGDLRYTALRNVSVTLEGVSASQEDAAVRSDVRSAALRTYLRFLRSLDFSANVGVQRQRFLNDGRVADQWFVTGYSAAELTPNLHLRLDGSYTRNRAPGTPATALSDRDERYTGDLYYRPGAQLAIGIQIGWVRSGGLSGTIQNYRLDWRPFPFGSLNLGGRYEENIEPFTNRRSQRLILDPRWRLNNHMTIDLNYTRENTTGIPRTNIFFAAFTATM